jgi:hypothetical protein
MRQTPKAAFLLVVVSVLTLGPLGTGLVSAKGSPAVMPRPATKLVGGQTIHLSGFNWPHNDSNLVAWQCNSPAHPNNPDYCDTTNAVPTSSNANGRLNATALTVTAGPVGIKGKKTTCGTSNTDKGCFVAVYDTAQRSVHAVGKIVFAAPHS